MNSAPEWPVYTLWSGDDHPPLPFHLLVEVRFADGRTDRGTVRQYWWGWQNSPHDIIAFKDITDYEAKHSEWVSLQEAEYAYQRQRIAETKRIDREVAAKKAEDVAKAERKRIREKYSNKKPIRQAAQDSGRADYGRTYIFGHNSPMLDAEGQYVLHYAYQERFTSPEWLDVN